LYKGECNKKDCKFKHDIDYKHDHGLLSAAITKAQSRQEPNQKPATKTVGLTAAASNDHDHLDWMEPASEDSDEGVEDDTDYDAAVCMTTTMLRYGIH
jgi:hypothetical protein